MKKPIQLWLPLFQNSPLYNFLDEDLRKAQDNFSDNELIIFLIPWIKEVHHITFAYEDNSYQIQALAVPSKTLNVIFVVHIDEKGNFAQHFSSCIPVSWNGKIPENLFMQLLNTPKILVSSTEQEISLKLPIEINNEINNELKLKMKKFNLKNIASPVVFDEKGLNKQLAMFYNPQANFQEDKAYNLEFEFYESNRFFKLVDNPIDILNGSYYKSLPEFFQGNPQNWVLDIDEEENISLKICFGFLEPPLKEMFPFGIGLELAYCAKLMKEQIEANSKGKKSNEMKKWLKKYITSGETTFYRAWLLPKLQTREEDSILTEIKNLKRTSFFDDFEIKTEIKTIADAKKDEIKEIKVECIRIFSWIGYFLWEVNKADDVRYCENECGHVIQGRPNKRYCSKEDNLQCYWDRKAREKRKNRSKKKSLQ